MEHDSMQAVSDSLLSRRARVGGPEEITADQRGGEGADDALQSRALPTDIAGSSAMTKSNTLSKDRRCKWSTEELEELMFCYFKARSEGPGYMSRLETLFIKRNPNNPKIHKFNGNTLSTQARRIIKQNVISQELLNRIQTQAEELTPTELSSTVIAEPENTRTTTVHDNLYDIEPIPVYVENIDQQTRNIIEDEDLAIPIVLQFLRILAETKEISFEERLLLPKAKINRSFIENLNILNNYLPNLLITNNSLREINDIIYATAKTLIQGNNQTPYISTANIKSKCVPVWKKRIQTKIDNFRKELGQLVEIKRGIDTHRMRKIRKNLYIKYNIQTENDQNNIIEIIKQKVKALAGRIKRYDEMNTKKEQNRFFKENEHRLYRSLGSNATKNIKIPKAKWVKEIEKASNEINEVKVEEITEDQVKFAVRKLMNWKSPGIDKIQNYYIKCLTSVHKYFAVLFTNIISGKEMLEDWFTTGKVILIPKNENTEDPENWRPIACLPSMYKLLTAILADVLYGCCHENGIIAEEQRGCRRRTRGCKDHLMVNKAILEDAHQSQKNLSMAWTDYQKAYDSVSHEWLLKILDIYKCPSVVKRFLQMTMPT
ncbi:uncharacterized protein [Centruroides vittatus]|uniref:uncharacterized protein n=1 Tax=Centruroides vittatus TaxID=120091 RepID=UPI00350FC5BD